MIDEAQARRLAEKAITHEDVSLGPAEELRQGWFFPWRTARVGCKGVIVNKKTGRILHLGSAFSVERDLAMYDRGYQFDTYDLVIVAVHDLEATCRALTKLRPTVVEPTYEHGQVWRIPKPIAARDLRSRLEKLPCIFPAMGLYFHLEVLEESRREGWFEFEALELKKGALSG